MITLLRGIAILGCIDYSSSRGTKFSSYTQILTVSFYNFNILYSAVFRVFSFFKKKRTFLKYIPMVYFSEIFINNQSKFIHSAIHTSISFCSS